MDGCPLVIHLAAIVGGIGNFHKLPHTLTEMNNGLYNGIFRAALDLGVERFTYVSSSMVFERATEFPTTEAHLPDCPTPQSAYGYSKLTGEVYCRAAHDEHGLPYTICRPFNAYGPGEVPDPEPGIAHMVPDVIKKVLSGQQPLQIFGDGTQTRTLTHIDDIADGIVTAMSLAGRPQRGLQHLRLRGADRRRDGAHHLGGVRRGPGRVRARAPADVRGRRRAPLAVGREGERRCSAGRRRSACARGSRRRSSGCASKPDAPPAQMPSATRPDDAPPARAERRRPPRHDRRPHARPRRLPRRRAALVRAAGGRLPAPR